MCGGGGTSTCFETPPWHVDGTRTLNTLLSEHKHRIQVTFLRNLLERGERIYARGTPHVYSLTLTSAREPCGGLSFLQHVQDIFIVSSVKQLRTPVPSLPLKPDVLPLMQRRFFSPVPVSVRPSVCGERRPYLVTPHEAQVTQRLAALSDLGGSLVRDVLTPAGVHGLDGAAVLADGYQGCGHTRAGWETTWTTC